MIWRIGHGAYGEVWLAHNVLGTFRAIKLVHRRNFSEEYPFEREFKGIQKYEPISRSHDGLIDILHVGRNEAAACFYYVMELADEVDAREPELVTPTPRDGSTGSEAPRDRKPPGSYVPRTLRQDLRRRGRLPVEECVAIGLPLSAALEHLHRNGLVHRDVKPSNIVFVDGVPKLADIGLVAEVEESRSFVGTIGFIPPEGPGAPPADVFALGKVLYEMLTGKDRLEFPGLPEEFLIHTGVPESKHVARQRRELNQIILRACESDIRRRYASAQAMHADLARLQRGEPLACGSVFQRFWPLKPVALLRRRWSRGQAEDMTCVVPEVNHLFEKGHLCALGATPERLRQAAKYFEQAVQRDPNFIPGQVGLFRVRLLELTSLREPPPDTASKLRAAAAGLLALTPTTAEACMAASVTAFLDGDLSAAAAEIRSADQRRACSRQTRAISHNLAGSYLLETGQAAAALQELRLSEKEVPTCAVGQVALGHPYFIQGKFDLALAQYQKSIELEPRQWLGHFWSARTYEEMGDYWRAIDEFEQADRRATDKDLDGVAPARGSIADDSLSPYPELRAALQARGPTGYWRKRLETALNLPRDPRYIAGVYARVGEAENAYAWLATAVKEKKLGGLCFDLCWDRKDPRFQRIVG